MKHFHKWLTELVWFARITYTDQHTDMFPVKVPSNQLRTPTGFANGYLFTIKDAHYFAFGQAGFGVHRVELGRKEIRYCEKTKMYEVL